MDPLFPSRKGAWNITIIVGLFSEGGGGLHLLLVTDHDQPHLGVHLVHQQLVLNELRHGDVASKELLLDSHGPPLPVQEGCLKYNYIYWAIFGRGGGGRAAFSTVLGFVLFSIWLHKLEKFTVHETKFQVVCLVHWLYTAASVCRICRQKREKGRRSITTIVLPNCFGHFSVDEYRVSSSIW